MNKLVKLFSVFAMSLAVSTSMWSCKGDTGATGATGAVGPTGTTGTAGTNGTNGTNGAANISTFQATINTSDWTTVQVNGIGSSVTDSWGAAKIANSTISGNYYYMVFLRSSNTGGNSRALPLTYTSINDNSLEMLNYEVASTQINLYYRKQYGLSSFTSTVSPVLAPSVALTFDVLQMQKSTATALKNSKVDMSNYSAVAKFVADNE